jgi:hypothetical protein
MGRFNEILQDKSFTDVTLYVMEEQRKLKYDFFEPYWGLRELMFMA